MKTFTVGRPGPATFLASVGLACCAMIFVPPAFATDCTVAALNTLAVAGVTITSADNIPARPPNPQYCHVKGSVATTGEGAEPSTAGFEADLPAHWNGKFLLQGVGGLAGSFNSSANPADRALFLARGYATAITDTGHLNTDKTWEFISSGQPNTPKLVDYFYRAVHEVTVAAKQVVKGYYNSRSISHSYFDGCSNGGKMGMLEAMRYPDDYDGIVAGAPWLDPLGTSLWSLKNIQALLAAYIPASLFSSIDEAIRKQCDGADSLLDGLIQNPARCSFNPDTLVPAVLTQSQADALKSILKPVKDEKGALVYPGSSVSNLGQFGTTLNELETPPANPTGSQPWGELAAPANWNLATGVILNLGFYDPSVDLNNAVETGGVVKPSALKLLYDRLGPDIPDDPSALRTFFGRGGKLLIYHGYNDLIISPYRSIWFYEDLAAENGGYEKITKEARLFMVPGMLHCTGGPGPNVFDTLTPMENWVEKGQAPDSIVASHAMGDTTDRTMPLCKFPEQARYAHNGDLKDAANWSCPANDHSLLEVGPNGIQSGLGKAERVIRAKTPAQHSD